MRNWLNRRVHVSRHIGCLSAGLIGGIGLSALVKTSSVFGDELVLVAIALFAVALARRRRGMLLLALLAGVLFGVWRGNSMLRSLTVYQSFYNQHVTLRGTVAEDTSVGTKGDQRMRLRAVVVDEQSLPGTIWVSSNEVADIKRGDMVEVKGLLTQGFGNMPASMHRAQLQAIERPVPGDIARRVRDWFTDGVRRAIPEPQASLSVGYLVGQKSALPDEISNQLKVVGLTHAVVASGYNLTILVGFTRRLFARFSKYLAVLLATVLVICFIFITGFSPSMTRAGLVCLLGLATWYYGRSMHPVILLVLSAAITAIWQPGYVWGDIGWYLSFTAFTGVIILAPLLKRYFFGDMNLGMLRQTLLDTLAAQLVTMPIILFSFGQYATYALLANILVLPLIPLAMICTFVAGVGGLVWPLAAHWFGWPARILLSCNLLVIGWIARLPGAQGSINFGLGMLTISYLGLLLVMTYFWHATRYDFRNNQNNISIF